MSYSIQKALPKILPRLYHFVQQGFSNYPIPVITLVALAAIGLYEYLKTPSSSKLRDPIIDPMTAENIKNFTDVNRESIQNKSYITKILFYGPSGDEQEIIAEKMARNLGLKFHCFDGRKLADDEYRMKTGWHFLFQRISSSDTPEFVFVSHADDVCRDRKINIDPPGGPSIGTILGYTGSASETVLLCLGVSSLDHLDPAIYSSRGGGCRYHDLLYVPLPGLKERLEILNTHLPKVFMGTTADMPSQEQLAKIAEKADGLSRKSLEEMLEGLHDQKAYASEWTVEMVDQAIRNKMERQRVPLPNLAERIRFIEKSNLPISKILTPKKLHSIAEKTEGFSQHMIWGMLLDISNQTLTDDYHKSIPLTESMVDRAIVDWTNRPKNARPDLNKRITIIQKYAKENKLELFTPAKIQPIAEDLEGLSEEYIFRMMQNCDPRWFVGRKELTEKELNQIVERWKPRPKGGFVPLS